MRDTVLILTYNERDNNLQALRVYARLSLFSKGDDPLILPCHELFPVNRVVRAGRNTCAKERHKLDHVLPKQKCKVSIPSTTCPSNMIASCEHCVPSKLDSGLGSKYSALKVGKLSQVW